MTSKRVKIPFLSVPPLKLIIIIIIIIIIKIKQKEVNLPGIKIIDPALLSTMPDLHILNPGASMFTCY